MNGFTRIFLVVLRLAIGWHFFFEGIEKIQSWNLGPTESNRPWTSKPYLREATGPMAPWFRKQAGEADEEVLALVEVLPLPNGQDPARVPPGQRISPALDQEWNAYLERYTRHYQLSPEQRALAETRLKQAKDQAVRWLTGETEAREVERVLAGNAIKVKETGAERVKAYVASVNRLRDLELRELPALGRDVAKQKLKSLKAETTRQRTEIVTELKKILDDALAAAPPLLTEEQVKLGPVPSVDPSIPSWKIWERPPLEQIDFVTRYGLTAVGLCLLLGLFTRLACVAGAGFLLMFYLSMPPFPWLPDNPRVEGHYLFVNKNLIELLALLTLATTRSGHWLGLDGLICSLFRMMFRRKPRAEDAALSAAAR